MGVLRNHASVSDALQTTFVRLMEKGGDVKSGAIRSWLFRVAYNEAMLLHRRMKVDRKAKETIAWQVSPVVEENEGLGNLVREERADQVNLALAKLPDVQREVVELRIREGLKFVEIAKMMDVPLGTVLTRMHSGLKKLRDHLEK